MPRNADPSVDEKIERIREDDSLALRASKDVPDGAPPDAQRVEAPRTAVRYDETQDQPGQFCVVTSGLMNFPLGQDRQTTGTEEEIRHWIDENDPEVIDAAEEDWDGCF